MADGTADSVDGGPDGTFDGTVDGTVDGTSEGTELRVKGLRVSSVVAPVASGSSQSLRRLSAEPPPVQETESLPYQSGKSLLQAAAPPWS